MTFSFFRSIEITCGTGPHPVLPVLGTFYNGLFIEVAVSLCFGNSFEGCYYVRSHIHQDLLCICHGVYFQSQLMELVGIFLDPLVFLAFSLQAFPLLLKGAVLGFHISCRLSECLGHILLLLPQTLAFLTLLFLGFSSLFGTHSKCDEGTDHSQYSGGQQNVGVGIGNRIKGSLRNGGEFGYNDTTTLGCSPERDSCRMCFFLQGADA